MRASTIFHMSSITQHWLTWVPAGASPFSRSALLGWWTSEHLHYIVSVWWETRHWWESQRKRETRKRIRGGRSMLPEMEGSQKYLNGQPRSVFLCSHTRTRHSVFRLIHEEGETLSCQFINCPPLLIRFDPSMANISDKDIWLSRLNWEEEECPVYKKKKAGGVGWAMKLTYSGLIKQHVTSELNIGVIKNGSNPLLSSI